jgi:DNA repair protein RadB
MREKDDERETTDPFVSIASGDATLAALLCELDLPPGSFISDEPVTAAMRIPTGATALDAMLGGGIESTALTLFYGEGGSGKTNVCIQVARSVARMKRKVLYIDTEGVSAERLEQIFAPDLELLKNLLFFRPQNFQEQERTVDKVCKLCEKMDVGGIIMDSATVFYRLDMGSTKQSERASLTRMVLRLMRAARTKDIPVILTTQVYYDQERQSIEPIGGHMLLHNAKTIVKFERDPNQMSHRRAVLIKHRSLQEGQSCTITLTFKGVE